MKKRIVIAADPHCGLKTGLTPPAWWARANTPVGAFQRHLWGFYSKAIDSLKPIDILCQPGDAIDGKGERSGGVELVTADRLEQAEMAAKAINYAKAPVVRLCYGTRYHAGKEEDFEKTMLRLVKGKVSIHGHDFIRVNGVNLDIKHKVGSSTIPHGRLTALARSRMWNTIWNAEHGLQPKADILIRAHVHYFGFAGGASWLGITCPALSWGSSYGIRECEGLVDIGLIVIDIENGRYTWRPVLASFKGLRVQAESL